MIHNGVTFEDALKQAQLNGYAEKDPTADIEGHDACRKICIWPILPLAISLTRSGILRGHH